MHAVEYRVLKDAAGAQDTVMYEKDTRTMMSQKAKSQTEAVETYLKPTPTDAHRPHPTHQQFTWWATTTSQDP